jgi:hypothetical protein
VPSSSLQEMRKDHLGRLRPARRPGAGRRPGLPALPRSRQRPCRQRQRQRLAAPASRPRLSRRHLTSPQPRPPAVGSRAPGPLRTPEPAWRGRWSTTRMTIGRVLPNAAGRSFTAGGNAVIRNWPREVADEADAGQSEAGRQACAGDAAWRHLVAGHGGPSLGPGPECYQHSRGPPVIHLQDQGIGRV